MSQHRQESAQALGRRVAELMGEEKGTKKVSTMIELGGEGDLSGPPGGGDTFPRNNLKNQQMKRDESFLSVFHPLIAGV